MTPPDLNALLSLPADAYDALRWLADHPPQPGVAIRGPGCLPEPLRRWVPLLLQYRLAYGLPDAFAPLHCLPLGELVLSLREEAWSKKRGARKDVRADLPGMRRLRDAEGRSFYSVGRSYGIGADAVPKRLDRYEGG